MTRPKIAVETPEELNRPTLLNEMTELTGGRAFGVENLDDLPDIAAKIGAELRKQYVLGYQPSNRARDARCRNDQAADSQGLSTFERVGKNSACQLGRRRPD